MTWYGIYDLKAIPHFKIQLWIDSISILCVIDYNDRRKLFLIVRNNWPQRNISDSDVEKEIF